MNVVHFNGRQTKFRNSFWKKKSLFPWPADVIIILFTLNHKNCFAALILRNIPYNWNCASADNTSSPAIWFYYQNVNCQDQRLQYHSQNLRKNLRKNFYRCFRCMGISPYIPAPSLKNKFFQVYLSTKWHLLMFWPMLLKIWRSFPLQIV